MQRNSLAGFLIGTMMVLGVQTAMAAPEEHSSDAKTPAASVSSTPVPLPAALPLFGAALLGLAGFGASKRRRGGKADWTAGRLGEKIH